MDWTDQGFVLGARKHGESSVIVSLLTGAHGRHGGLVRGGQGRRARGVYQPGNLLAVHWRGRLAEHLGTLTGEIERAFAAEVMGDPLRLMALGAAAALVDAALAERVPDAGAFARFGALMEALPGAAWAADYARWELALLAGLGYGLDLGACAATGATEELIYVSPRSGQAVSAAAGEPYRDRLLALPGFLRPDGGPPDFPQIIDALTLTGHFLDRHVFGPHGAALPSARARLVDRLRRSSTISGRDCG